MLKQKRFLIFWFTQTISNAMNAMHILVLPLWVLESTGSTFQTGIVFVIELIIIIIFSKVAGKLTDRFDAKSSLVVLEVCRALLIFLFSFEVIRNNTVGIYTIIALYSICSSMFFPLQQKIIKSNVEYSSLPKANSLFSMSAGLASIIGPAIGAVTITKFGFSNIFLLNSVSFLIAGFAGLCLKKTGNNPTVVVTPKDLILFFPNFKSMSSAIRNILIVQTLTYFSIGANAYLFVMLMKEKYFSVADMSLAMASHGLGVFAGSLLFPVFFGETKRPIFTSLIASSFMGVSLLLLSLNTNVFLAYILFLLYGSLFVTYGLSMRTYLQKLSQKTQIGQNSSYYKLMNQVGSSCSLFMALLFVTLGYSFSFIMMGLSMFLIAGSLIAINAMGAYKIEEVNVYE